MSCHNGRMKIITRFASLSVLLFIFALVPSLALAANDPVSILDNSYSPQSITVNPGDTVVWTNYGSLSHTVVADNNAFVSGATTAGVNFSYTFNSPGIYRYHDQSYGAVNGVGMSGAITVTGGQSQVGVTAQSTTQTGTAATTASLTAQAQALLAQITQLQAQYASGGTGTGSNTGTIANSSACPNIGRTLRLGSSGTDVSRLQVYLAQDHSVYAAGTVSGYYGSLTQAAVQQWQAKYNIVSSGSPGTTGWGVVGPRTAAAIALLCSTGSTTGSTTGNSGGSTPPVTSNAPSVGGLLTVTPLTGAAPLNVNIQTTVNTTDSCVGTTYVLNFGDGTQSIAIPTQSGNCLPQLQAFSHTYSAGGTYTVVLAAGTHQTTATITVIGAAIVVASSTIPADSMRASITSGSTPLAVVFTGTVSSPATLGCTGSCSATINFGDGQVALVPLPTTVGGWQSYVVNHTYAAVGNYTAQLQSVTGFNEGTAITITATTPVNQTGGTYNILSITTASSSLPVASSISIALPACAAYEINWGDSTALTTGTGGCVAGGTTVSVNHSYAAVGSFTISLEDANGNVKKTSSVTIQ
jgi:plastocyanin/peptidoglycan hydrolase-like protein with peptidoglycan-binding domain